MSTVVVNVKRTKPFTGVYIGRAWSGPSAIGGPWPESPFANPFISGRDGEREEVVAKYETWMRERLATEPGLWDELMQLEGKTLGCWCAPKPCHGDVLVRLIEERRAELSEVRHPLTEAQAIAGDIAWRMTQYCERIQIAGSIRRKKPSVKDIEIVAVPRVEISAFDLFGQMVGSLDLLHQQVTLWRDQGVVEDRLDKNGRPAFGKRYKRLRYRGIGLDLFSVTPATWGVQLAIRTGSAEFSERFMTPRRWGGNLPDHMIVRDGVLYRDPKGRALPMDREARRRLDVATLEAVPTPEETDFFAAIGMPWVDPEARV